MPPKKWQRSKSVHGQIQIKCVRSNNIVFPRDTPENINSSYLKAENDTSVSESDGNTVTGRCGSPISILLAGIDLYTFEFNWCDDICSTMDHVLTNGYNASWIHVVYFIEFWWIMFMRYSVDRRDCHQAKRRSKYLENRLETSWLDNYCSNSMKGSN